MRQPAGTWFLLWLLAAGALALGADATPSLEAVEARLKAREYPAAAAEARAMLPGLGESPEAARLLDIVVEATWRGALNDPGARALGERAVALRTRLAGPEDASVAMSLHLLGNLSQAQGDATAARAYYERSLAIREKVFGAEAPEVVPSLNNLGNITRSLGDLEASRRVLERALAIREKTLPPTSRDLARSHVSLGNTLSELGVLDEAERHLARAVEILRAQEVRDQQLSSSLNTQSQVLVQRGKYEEAETALRLAIENERALGPTSDLPMYLGNLAVLRRDRGDLADARALQEEALRLEVASPAPDPSWRGLLLNNLGHLFLLMGDPSGARPVLEQALGIQRSVLPADHPQIATTLQNLGHVSLKLGQPDKARPIYEQAVGILERTVGSGHRSYGEALVDLGTATLDETRYAEAADLFRRALAIFEGTVGPTSLLTVRARILLADAQAAMNQPEAAREGYAAALAIVEPTFGKNHIARAEILARLAHSLALEGKGEDALGAALEAEATRVAVVRAALPVLPYRQGLAFTAAPGGLHVALSLAVRARGAETVRRTWDSLIQARALTLDGMLGQGVPSSFAVDLEVARNQYVQLLVKGERERLLEEARLRIERVEQAAAERSARAGLTSTRPPVDTARLAKELPPETVLVAYVHYRDLLTPAQPERYVAFVLAPGGEPRLVPLGAAAEIDRLVAAWRREVTAPAVAGMRRDTQTRYDSAGVALAAAIWTPLRPHIARARTVLVVPDGTLQLVSFPSLRPSRSKYLAETGPAVHLLPAERDLVRPLPPAAGQGLLAVAAPDFNGGPQDADTAAPAPSPSSMITALRATTRGGSFQALPATRTEVERVLARWNAGGDAGTAATVMEGTDATEASVRAEAGGKKLIHFATHGFFLAPAGGGTAEDHGTRVLEQWSKSGSGYVSAHNPMLLAGLALAGANRTLAGRPPADQDGLLLAEELALLNLQGTEWVVLSACETGIGELVPGEGVIGLRGAVLAAGARTVLMSLWKVEDEATAAWMDALYQARLGSGASTADAVAQANRALLSARRKAGKSTHPFYWAAFVAAGDWR